MFQGTVFDPETGDRLHIELAKSTSRRPRGGVLCAIANFPNIIRFPYLPYVVLICHGETFNSNQIMPMFLLGGDVYRVIDKRVNRTGGNDEHENAGDEGDREVWEEEDDVGNDDNGQSCTTLYC
jgi:hypothetical protein